VSIERPLRLQQTRECAHLRPPPVVKACGQPEDRRSIPAQLSRPEIRV